MTTSGKRANHARSPRGGRAVSARGRPRDEGSDHRILTAARELLAERGVDAMTFEAIAQRASATRPSIYRRWPSKAHLLHEIANGSGIPDGAFAPDTTLEDAIRDLADRVWDHYAKPEVRAANIGMIVAYQHSPDLRQTLQSPIEAAARRDLSMLVDRAKAEGLISPTINSDIIFDMVVGAIAFRTIFSSKSPTAGMADAICDMIRTGLACGEARSRTIGS